MTIGEPDGGQGAASGDLRCRRWARRFAVLICLLISGIVICGLPLYVRPQIDQLRRADAIVVLGGKGDSRYDIGLSLGMEGWAPDLVVSNPADAAVVWGRDFCSHPPAGLRMHCFVPDPGTTKGEGRELRRLAGEHGWRSVIVVTFNPHISRARFILERCFDGDLIMVASPVHLSMKRWVYEYGYQTAGFLRTLLQPGC